MRRLWATLILLPLVAAGCAVHTNSPDVTRVLAAQVQRCAAGEVRPLGSRRPADAGVALPGAIAYRRPNGAVRARFGPKNVNDYPTVFGVVGAVVRRDCTPTWYRVQL